jgi:hypothetical protein
MTANGLGPIITQRGRFSAVACAVFSTWRRYRTLGIGNAVHSCFSESAIRACHLETAQAFSAMLTKPSSNIELSMAAVAEPRRFHQLAQKPIQLINFLR